MTNSLRDLTASSYEDAKRKLMTGRKSVLVIRAVAADAETTASESELSDAIFGTHGDAVNLKSQFRACSDGKLQFEPLTSNKLVRSDGVYTVNLPTTFVSEAEEGNIADAMVEQAQSDLGAPLDQLADYVMVCIPPGSTGGWVGYAFKNHWLSVYADDNCKNGPVQMHEIGTSRQ
jgi:L-ascorbate metabolism protein UlaG (beta-lactamase superfamily)